MIGAIIGDIVGSRFEWHNIKTKEFEFFHENCHPTDDSIMTLAVAKAIMEGKDNLSANTIYWMQKLGQKYPRAGYGGHFRKWLYEENPQPYGSWGNGSAMRVSSCGFVAKSLEESVSLSKAITQVSHNHPEGMKGAEAVAVAIYLAKIGNSKDEIRDYICKNYYDINFTLNEIRDSYTFDVSCQGSVPEALEAFFEAVDFEDAIRNAVSIGGDSDTIAAITGGIAEAYYGIPEKIYYNALVYLDDYQIRVLREFEKYFLK